MMTVIKFNIPPAFYLRKKFISSVQVKTHLGKVLPVQSAIVFTKRSIPVDHDGGMYPLSLKFLKSDKHPRKNKSKTALKNNDVSVADQIRRTNNPHLGKPQIKLYRKTKVKTLLQLKESCKDKTQ